MRRATRIVQQPLPLGPVSERSKLPSSLHSASSIPAGRVARSSGDTAALSTSAPTASANPESRRPVPSLKSFSSAVIGFIRDDTVALVILAAAFLTRWLLADVNSYWLDELYSVSIYGVWNDSAMAAVDHLANTSVHPPLYQFILYNWMDWLGESEVITRTLSNVYVTLAGLFLYLLTRDAFSRVIAIWTTVLFSLMYTTMFFGLETRSYAQTIFLATLSSYLLLRVMRSGSERGWRHALVSPTGGALVVTNTALLLTHYYNVFFLIAQGICVAAFVFLHFPRRKWISGLGIATVLYGLPALLFTAAWGRAFVESYRRRAAEYAVESGSDLISPVDVLNQSVVTQNITAPRVLVVTGVILSAATLFASVLKIASRRKTWDAAARSEYTATYFFAWLVLPVVVAYAAFSLVGVARYSDRYFLFSTIPLAAIIVVSISQTSQWGRSLVPWLRRIPLTILVGVTSLTVIAATIAPGTYLAATAEKSDFRGTVQEIVGVVEADQNSSYVLYETSFRTTPVLDYYLARYSDTLRVDGTIRIAEERRGGPFRFEDQGDLIRRHDFIIVPFIHHSTRHFPEALDALERLYEVHHRHLDAGGRGYIVFAVDPDSGEQT